MNLGRELRRRLSSGNNVTGSWLSLGNVAAAEIMAAAGFDFLVIDLEHSSTSLETAAEMIRVIDLVGVSPMVRVTSNNGDQIKRVLDAGAHGIIVPNVRSGEEARYAVQSTQYPPRGFRGVGLYRAQSYGAQFDSYLEASKDGIAVILQIESSRAVHNIEDIVTTDGVDAVMIGPYDLSSDLGNPGDFESAEFVSASHAVLGAAAQAKVPVGIHVVEPSPSLVEQAARQGYRLLVYSVDMRILDVGARSGLDALKDDLR